MISEEAKELLKLARDAISSRFSGRLEIRDELKKKFSNKQGVFVTLKKDNVLRGCIGYAEPVFPLWQGTVNAALGAAFSDPRFPPLSEDELKEIKVEVSVLTKPELIEVKKPEDYLKKIKIGRDGLIVKSEFGSGLLLPEVPVEWNWTVQEFLEHLCLKASLSPNSWHDLNNKIYKFRAEKFEENGRKNRI